MSEHQQQPLERTVWDAFREEWRRREAGTNLPPAQIDFIDPYDDGAVITCIVRIDGCDDHRKMSFRDDVSIARCVADVWRESGRIG